MIIYNLLLKELGLKLCFLLLFVFRWSCWEPRKKIKVWYFERNTIVQLWCPKKIIWSGSTLFFFLKKSDLGILCDINVLRFLKTISSFIFLEFFYFKRKEKNKNCKFSKSSSTFSTWMRYELFQLSISSFISWKFSMAFFTSILNSSSNSFLFFSAYLIIYLKKKH